MGSLSELGLQTPEDRKALNEMFDLVFFYVENIEEAKGAVKLEVYEAIKKRILEIYTQLCVLEFKRVYNNVDSNDFHRDRFNINDLIEIRGLQCMEAIVTGDE